MHDPGANGPADLAEFSELGAAFVSGCDIPRASRLRNEAVRRFGRTINVCEMHPSTAPARKEAHRCVPDGPICDGSRICRTSAGNTWHTARLPMACDRDGPVTLSAPVRKRRWLW